jgi:hypothetical protein
MRLRGELKGKDLGIGGVLSRDEHDITCMYIFVNINVHVFNPTIMHTYVYIYMYIYIYIYTFMCIHI